MLFNTFIVLLCVNKDIIIISSNHRITKAEIVESVYKLYVMVNCIEISRQSDNYKEVLELLSVTLH